MTVENEKAIRAVVAMAVKSYASGFSDRHLAEVDDEDGFFDCIRYCDLGANRFVLQRYMPRTKDFLCLHQETIEDEQQEMLSFLESCKWVSITQANGRTNIYPLSDFTQYADMELEHNSQNIIINLSTTKHSSYTYSVNNYGEIEDRCPLKDIIIYK